MKKIIVIAASLILSAAAANAQSGLLGALKGALTGDKTESASADAATSAAGNVLGTLLGNVISQNVTVSLPGTWTYNGVSSAIETDNTLTTLAASAYKENLEAKLDGYLKKVGIVPGVATLTFNTDNTFTIVSGAKTIASGTYTYENKALVMKFGKLYNYLTMEGTVTATTGGAQLLFDADKFLSFATKAIKVVGAKSSNSTLKSLSGIIDQVTGLKLGFDLKK